MAVSRHQTCLLPLLICLTTFVSSKKNSWDILHPQDWNAIENVSPFLRSPKAAATIHRSGHMESVARKNLPLILRSRRASEEASELSLNEVYCRTNFDAAANIRNELFFFKGTDFWRVNKAVGLFAKGMLVSSFWKDFTGDAIDAAFTRPSDQYIVFISGNQYWVYVDPTTLDPKSPYSTCDFGLCNNEKIDAAVVWGANKRVYIFARDQYWKLDENMKTHIGYPKNISELRGVPKELDAAVEDFDGKTFFLKGQRCLNLNDHDLAIDANNSDFIGSKWFGCNRSSYETATISSPLGGNGDAKSNFRNEISFALIFMAVTWNIFLC